MSITWQCTPFDAGHLIEASRGDVRLAYLIRHAEWRDAHDREWLFSSVVRTLARNIARVMQDGDARGKACPKCGGGLSDLRGHNQRQCSNGKCKHVEPWNLSEGQRPLLGCNRQDRKVME